MKIRWKLLILLLVIALVPLILSSALERLAMRRLGQHLASSTREVLADNARRHLKHLVDSYGRLLNRDKERLELILHAQARAAEQRLAAPPPENPSLFFSDDYDKGVNVPEGMEPSTKHFREGGGGKLSAVQITYRQQVCFLAAGADKQALADDLARLSTMPDAYEFLYRSSPQTVYWQYTSLESGIHTCYPGHGGYPGDYDPRQRDWYRAAKEAARLIWLPPAVEVSTRTVTLTLAMPLGRTDGSFAGVTAIDVPLAGMFRELKLPEAWARHAKAMLVMPGRKANKGKLVILAQQSYEGRNPDWRAPVQLQLLASRDAAGLTELTRAAAAGRPGVRTLRYQGREAFWACGQCEPDRPFPIVVVPYDRVIAQAVAEEQYVLDRTVKGLKVTGIILLAVVVAVAVIAFVSSRSVTRPLGRLMAAAEKLAGGDYDAKVSIRTRDEFQQLGEIFNDMGPKLQERERMKHSLDVAMEVQQHLMPQGSPELRGFDVSGKSIYCDETGGDYYDFIDLADLGPGKLGIAVGDITGHGIAAALLMTSARAVLRSNTARHGDDLSRLFGVLNEHLVRDTADDRFLTLFYAVLDAEERCLRWISGGHDPALWLRRSSGQIEELGGAGIPLGIFSDSPYSQSGPVTLETGDVVVIGTDGIWEAENPEGQMFGKQRLRDVVASCSDRPAAEIHAAVIDAENAFRAAEPQKDDITIVVIKAV